MSKRFFHLLVLALLVVGCTREVNFDELQDRGGVFFERNQETGFTGTYIQYDEEEKTKPKIIASLKLGRYHGTKTEFYEDGQKKSESSWKFGKRDGISTTWHENGQKSSEENWAGGIKNGLANFWQDDGSSNGCGPIEFKNGQAACRYFRESDSLWVEQHFSDGILDRVLLFDENNNRLQEDKLENSYSGLSYSPDTGGTWTFKTFYPSGRIHGEGGNHIGAVALGSQHIFTDTSPTMPQFTWYESGRIKGVQGGSKTWCEWYEDGSRKDLKHYPGWGDHYTDAEWDKDGKRTGFIGEEWVIEWAFPYCLRYVDIRLERGAGN